MRRRRLLAWAGLTFSTSGTGCLGAAITDDSDETTPSATATPRVEDPHEQVFPEDLRVQNETDDPLDVTVEISDSDNGERIDVDTYEVPECDTVAVETRLPRTVYRYTLVLEDGAEKTEPYTPSTSSYLLIVIHSQDEIEANTVVGGIDITG